MQLLLDVVENGRALLLVEFREFICAFGREGFEGYLTIRFNFLAALPILLAFTLLKGTLGTVVLAEG